MVCSRGESLTHRINQMKPFNAIAAAAVMGGSMFAIKPAHAQEFAVPTVALVQRNIELTELSS